MLALRSKNFTPLTTGPLCDGELELLLENVYEGDGRRGWVPFYEFGMWTREGRAGDISLRIGNTREIVLYYGHIGYGVRKEFRGRRFAARACQLLLPLARAHGLDPLWITVSPDNVPSRRTCDLLGARYIETVDVPRNNPLWKRGEPQKCRYRLDIG